MKSHITEKTEYLNIYNQNHLLNLYGTIKILVLINLYIFCSIVN